MKIIKLLLTIMFLSFAWVTYAQVTVGIPDTAVTGSGSINIPIKVTNFNDVGAISLKINYDPSVLTFQGVPNPLSGSFIANAANGVISISWFGLTPLNIGNGTLINLQLNYTGVGTSTLVFNKLQSEITNSAGTTISTQSSFKDGSVFSATNQSITFSLPTTSYTVNGMDINVPVNVINYNNIGATTLKIKYDPSVLTYKGLANAPTGFQASVSAGVITVSYSGSSSLNFGNGKLFDLQFNYVGGNSSLLFTQSTVTNILGQIITSQTSNGLISGPGVSSTNATISLPDTNVSINSNLNVPVSVSNFVNVGSISLKINYNSSVLTFKGITNTANSNSTWYANASNGVITIGWNSPDAVTPINIPSGKLLDLQFAFTEGSSPISFQTSSEITSITNVKIPLAFKDGSVTAPKQISLGDVKANVGDVVYVPLTVKNFKNVGSISLKFTYDPAVIKYVGLDSDSVGFTATSASGANGTVALAWYSVDPRVKPLSIVSGTLAKIKFTYVDKTSALVFNNAQCQITDTALNVLQNVAFVNGSVSKDIIFALGNVRGNNGGDVAVPVTIKNITNIGSMSVKINFDPAKLTFKSIKNFNGSADKLQAYSAAGSGVLTIGYADVTALNISQNKVFDVVFTLNSNSAVGVTFASGNQITDNLMNTITGITYTDGTISINQKPAITGIAPKTSPEGTKITFTLTATDPEKDPVVISSANLPTGATLVAGTFTWTPDYTQAGTYNVKFTATDSIGAFDTTTVILNITNLNRAPVFTVAMKADTTYPNVGGIGTAFKFKYAGSSPEGKALTFFIANAPANSSIGTSDGSFVWDPGRGTLPAGKYTVKIGLTDKTDTVYSQSTITVPIATSVLTEEGIPTEYNLAQNYPNPFNPSTSIKYAIPSESHVSVKVFNTIGQEVATLVNEVQHAGNYRVNFDASKLTSGVYIYTIKANNFVTSRKMILVK